MKIEMKLNLEHLFELATLVIIIQYSECNNFSDTA